MYLLIIIFFSVVFQHTVFLANVRFYKRGVKATTG